jgi:hypothetical protein
VRAVVLAARTDAPSEREADVIGQDQGLRVCEGFHDPAPLAEFIRNSWTVCYGARIAVDLSSEKRLGDIVKRFSRMPYEFVKQAQSAAEHVL